jgi:branched-chain amino acid transport system ATP-binding protein
MTSPDGEAVAPNKRPEESVSAGSLVARDVTVRFGAIVALEAVSLESSQGEILGLIGPNGAGKTTLINVLSGFQRTTRGAVRIGHRDITNEPAPRRARHGLARTFQAARLFSALTVAENLEVYASTIHRRRSQSRALVAELLEAGDLTRVADVRASALPQGLERRVALMRSLALLPTHLLLDEPAAGLDDIETAELAQLIQDLPRRFGCGVLLVEHDMRLIMSVCDRIQVLNYGRTLCVGTPEQVSADPEVREAYLGKPAEGTASKVGGGGA